MKEFTRRGFVYAAATLAGYGVLIGVERVCSSAFADGVEPTNGPGPVKIIKVADDGTSMGALTTPKVQKSTAQWKAQLTALQFDVTRRAATEWAFTGALDNEHRAGLYRCIDCDNALLIRVPSLTLAPDGPVFSSLSPRKTSVNKKIFPTG